jgi:hypothetical protein
LFLIPGGDRGGVKTLARGRTSCRVGISKALKCRLSSAAELGPWLAAKLFGRTPNGGGAPTRAPPLIGLFEQANAECTNRTVGREKGLIGKEDILERVKRLQTEAN